METPAKLQKLTIFCSLEFQCFRSKIHFLHPDFLEACETVRWGSASDQNDPALPATTLNSANLRIILIRGLENDVNDSFFELGELLGQRRAFGMISGRCSRKAALRWEPMFPARPPRT